jgi:hypothetical protein
LEILQRTSRDSPLGLQWSIAQGSPGTPEAPLADSAQHSMQQHLGDGQFMVDHGHGRTLTVHADGRAVLVLGNAPALHPRQLHHEAVIIHQLLTGRTVLHGSAVSINGHGVVVIGTSGAGKSTTATALIRRGAALLSDDVVVIDHSTAQPRLLRVESAIRLIDASHGAKRELRPVQAATPTPTDVRMIVALSVDQGFNKGQWSRLAGLAALDTIVELGAGSRGLAIHGPAQFVQQLSRIADQAQVWRLRRTPTSPTPDRIASEIERIVQADDE